MTIKMLRRPVYKTVAKAIEYLSAHYQDIGRVASQTRERNLYRANRLNLHLDKNFTSGKNITKSTSRSKKKVESDNSILRVWLLMTTSRLLRASVVDTKIRHQLFFSSRDTAFSRDGLKFLVCVPFASFFRCRFQVYSLFQVLFAH